VSELTPAQKARVAKWKAANPGKRQGKPKPNTREPYRLGGGGRVFEQGIAEEQGRPRIRKYTYERPDGSVAVRYEVLDAEGRRMPGQGPEGFDDPKFAKDFLRRVSESSSDVFANNDSTSPVGGNVSESNYWKRLQQERSTKLNTLSEEFKKALAKNGK
jgi:hypothetical protein